ncbi:hypothetical protein ABBQ38_013112 [Trebouxia sp. C0009 RCD-2024]
MHGNGMRDQRFMSQKATLTCADTVINLPLREEVKGTVQTPTDVAGSAGSAGHQQITLGNWKAFGIDLALWQDAAARAHLTCLFLTPHDPGHVLRFCYSGHARPRNVHAPCNWLIAAQGNCTQASLGICQSGQTYS